MSFTPQGYEPPKTKSNYFQVSKLKEKSDNIIRILSKPIFGWLDWSEDGSGKKTPVRTPYNQPEPNPINPAKPVKHFWAMTIWDYSDKSVKIMEVTQSTIQDAIYTLDCDEAWGDPMSYDINIKRTGEKLETKYTVTPRPPKPLAQEIKDALKETNPDLNELFSNKDPFAKKASETNDFNTDEAEEINVEDLPF